MGTGTPGGDKTGSEKTLFGKRKSLLYSGLSYAGSIFGEIHNAISSTVESGFRSVMGTATANNTLTSSEFSDVVSSGDESAFYAGLESDGAAAYNAVPTLAGEVVATTVELAAFEFVRGGKSPKTNFKKV